jgi:hypothetical protein
VEPDEELKEPIVFKSVLERMIYENRRRAARNWKRFDNLVPDSIRTDLYGASVRAPSASISCIVNPLYTSPEDSELFRVANSSSQICFLPSLLCLNFVFFFRLNFVFFFQT